MEFHGNFTHKGDYWAVYYDDINKTLATDYIIGFEIWTHEVKIDKDYETVVEYYPLELDPDHGVTIASEVSNYLGISEVPQPNMNDWQNEIKSLQKRAQSS